MFKDGFSSLIYSISYPYYISVLMNTRDQWWESICVINMERAHRRLKIAFQLYESVEGMSALILYEMLYIRARNRAMDELATSLPRLRKFPSPCINRKSIPVSTFIVLYLCLFSLCLDTSPASELNIRAGKQAMSSLGKLT